MWGYIAFELCGDGGDDGVQFYPTHEPTRSGLGDRSDLERLAFIECLPCDRRPTRIVYKKRPEGDTLQAIFT